MNSKHYMCINKTRLEIISNAIHSKPISELH